MIAEKFLVDLIREKKLKDAFNEAQKTRPEYNVPDATKSAYATASREYNNGELPGLNRILDKIGTSSANSIAAAQQGGNALGSIAGIQAGENDALLNVGVANAEYRKSNLDRLLRESQNMAAAQDMQWQMNQYAPWADRYNFKTQMTNLANQRWTTALDSTMRLAGLATSVATGGAVNPAMISGAMNSYQTPSPNDVFRN